MFLAAFAILPAAGFAQSDDSNEVTAPEVKPAEQPATPQAPAQQIDKRIFGVLPNYRTADGSAPFEPITAKHKFYIASKDSFDYPVYLTSALFAGLYQMDNQNPSFGQGLKGYAKRLATSYGDQAIGNLMTEAIFPSLLHEDPRYFRIGAAGGTKMHRMGYALTRVFVVRTDKGKSDFNYSEWLGNGSAVAISNLYYPGDTRNVTDNVQKLGVAVATDAFSQVLKEFWPDIKHKFFNKKKSYAPRLPPAFPVTAGRTLLQSVVDEHNGQFTHLATSSSAKPTSQGMEGYLELYRRAEQDPEAFWGDIAEREIHWFEKWTKVLDWQPPFAKWFVGAKTNVSYNCVDRHCRDASQEQGRDFVGGRAGRAALHHLSGIAPAGFALRQRAEVAWIQGGRPRHHLHADDSGAAHRHAGVRAAGDHA